MINQESMARALCAADLGITFKAAGELFESSSNARKKYLVLANQAIEHIPYMTKHDAEGDITPAKSAYSESFRQFFERRNGCPFPANIGTPYVEAFKTLADTVAEFMDEVAKGMGSV